MKVLGALSLFLPSLILSQQTPFNTNQNSIKTTSIPLIESLSLVDLLSASTNHTLLLRAFQKARLIPLLNRLNGSTLFAPTDEVIKSERNKERKKGLLPSESIWTYAISEITLEEQVILDGLGTGEYNTFDRDNLQLALRDTLLYHILNYTLFPAPLPPSNDTESILRHTLPLPLNSITLQETLYLPSLSPYNSSFPSPPTLPGSPPDDPDPDGPDKDRSKTDGLLRGEGQKLRVVRKEEKKGKNSIWIGVDWKGIGGFPMLTGSERYARNGALVEVNGILTKPVDLATQIRTNPELSTLAALLPTTILDYLSTAPHLTLFAPTNQAWSSLSDLEMRYLKSGFAETDLTEIFGDGASKEGAGDGKVGYLLKLLGGNSSTAAVSTILGGSLVVSSTEQGLVEVNGTRIETGDILSKNGVLHTVPTLLLPSGSLSLTVEKYLIALNATRFVSLLRSVNLSHYVQVPIDQKYSASKPHHESYTILAPKDEVLTSSPTPNWRWWHSLPEPGTNALKQVLEYHIVRGKWTPDEFEDGMLIGTELQSEGLKGGKQQLPVSVHYEEDLKGNGLISTTSKSKDKKVGIVGFGGASVISDPVEVGHSIIYLLSSVLEPPTSVITTAVSDLRLSTFVASVYAAALDKEFSLAPGITYLIPANNAFSSLGLVMSYLLLPVAREELKSVLKYHAVDEIVYLDEFPIGGSKRFPTLDGTEMYIERSNLNSTITIHGPTIGGSPANGESRDAKLIEGDILISTGVLHIIDQVELPPHLDIGIAKLMKGAKANTMADLIRAANMSWILEGRTPPDTFSLGSNTDEDEWEVEGLDYEGGRKKRRERRREERRKAKANRAYTLLCPTDKALAKLNLTYYLSDLPALTDLIKLHIIPTDAFSQLNPDGKPLNLLDEINYTTLLDVSEEGNSNYGTLAFRKWGEEGWMVGIKSARGTNGASDSARIVSYGRSTPWFIPDEEPGDDDDDDDDEDPDEPFKLQSSSTNTNTSTTRRKQFKSYATGGVRLANGGGILTIDSVLLPYQPKWLIRFGWIMGLTLLGFIIFGLVGMLGWKIWKGKQIDYERLEGEED